MNLTENKLKAWTVKYGHQQDVLQLLDKYNNFVIGNNIFQEFNKAFIDMQNVVHEYKHECNVEYKESVAIEKFMRQTAEQWKSIAMELRCAQSMLEEVILYWRRWKSLSLDIKMWLSDAVQKVNLTQEQRIEFFQVFFFLEQIGRIDFRINNENKYINCLGYWCMERKI